MGKRELKDMVEEILESYRGRFPPDIIDRVFVAIENQTGYLRLYESFVKRTDRQDVNMAIGRWTKQITGLRKLDRADHPQSRLIKSYHRLG